MRFGGESGDEAERVNRRDGLGEFTKSNPGVTDVEGRIDR